MFYYARAAVKKEALDKSSAALDGMIQRIDNRLREVEMISANMYADVEKNLDDADSLQQITHKMLDSNPTIVGCAIALDPSSLSKPIVSQKVWGWGSMFPSSLPR